MGGPGFRYPTYLDGRIECIPQQVSKRARKQRRIVAVRLRLAPPLSIPSEREGEIEGGAVANFRLHPNTSARTLQNILTKSPAQCQCRLAPDHANGTAGQRYVGAAPTEFRCRCRAPKRPTDPILPGRRS